MNRFLLLLASLALIVSLSLTAKAEGRRYVVNFPSYSQGGAKIVAVTIEKKRTIIEVSFVNEAQRMVRVRVYPPGSKSAFFISALANNDLLLKGENPALELRNPGAPQKRPLTTRFPLKGSEGIAVSPYNDHIPPGGRVDFKLFFDPIPFNAFDLVEGDTPPEGEVAWHFKGVELR